jgi:hypothetical protein
MQLDESDRSATAPRRDPPIEPDAAAPEPHVDARFADDEISAEESPCDEAGYGYGV